MRKIVHISDIHFGSEDQGVVERLVEKIIELEPHLIVVSGDLTQRARKSQFEQAREFLNRLPQPQVVVPGNHDVPLYNAFDRFVHPLDKYKKFVSDDLEPFFQDDEMAVIGVNTARSLTIKGGRISAEQVAKIRMQMSTVSDELLKVVVTHHPFDVPDGRDEDDIVARAKEAMPLIAESGADVFLAGHLHISHIGQSARRYKLDDGYSALIIQAGTAASVRERGEENSFNLLEFERPFLTVRRFQCSIPSAGFHLAADERFTQSEHGWSRM
ncbi:MAG: metallophosphoesterase [Acidobacteria bacterium]|nr:metallophosphoesterase [Acidobacteriota bacterium]